MLAVMGLVGVGGLVVDERLVYAPSPDFLVTHFFLACNLASALPI